MRQNKLVLIISASVGFAATNWVFETCLVEDGAERVRHVHYERARKVREKRQTESAEALKERDQPPLKDTDPVRLNL